MNIWVFTNEYEGNIIGGLGIVATNLSKSLAKLGHSVTVVCPGKRSKISVKDENTLRVIRFPRNSNYISLRNGVFNPAKIALWLSDHGMKKPDLIHVHSLQCYELAKHYKRTSNIPVIYTCHSLVALEGSRGSRKEIADRQMNMIRVANAVIVPSIWQKKITRKHFHFYKKEIKVIHNGIQLQHVGKNSNRQRTKRLLYVGRLTRAKGIQDLLGAISRLKKGRPWIRLDIVGQGSPRFRNKLKQMSNRIGIRKNVYWLGKLEPEKVRKLYSTHGSVVMPSRHESFGLVALEAMASGVPLVSTRNGGLSSFVNESNATIIRGVSPTGIARGIRAMWDNPTLTAKRVDNALATARKFDWKQSSLQYEQYFSKWS